METKPIGQLADWQQLRSPEGVGHRQGLHSRFGYPAAVSAGTVHWLGPCPIWGIPPPSIHPSRHDLPLASHSRHARCLRLPPVRSGEPVRHRRRAARRELLVHGTRVYRSRGTGRADTRAVGQDLHLPSLRVTGRAAATAARTDMIPLLFFVCTTPLLQGR